MARVTKDEGRSSRMFSREWIQLYIFTFATLLGVYQFILKDIIRPAQEPTAASSSRSASPATSRFSVFGVTRTRSRSIAAPVSR